MLYVLYVHVNSQLICESVHKIIQFWSSICFSRVFGASTLVWLCVNKDARHGDAVFDNTIVCIFTKDRCFEFKAASSVFAFWMVMFSRSGSTKLEPPFQLAHCRIKILASF